MTASPLTDELSRLQLSLSANIETKLRIYVTELEHWKRKVNLTALEGSDLCRRLVAEPCWIGRKLQMSGKLLDLGSGNGSPGVPLLLGCGLRGVHLVEARLKRAAFLRHIATRLDERERIVVQKTRLEDLDSPPKDIEWITLQGVRPVPALVDALKRLFIPTTRVVWITARGREWQAGSTIFVPQSNTAASILQLDQF